MNRYTPSPLQKASKTAVLIIKFLLSTYCNLYRNVFNFDLNDLQDISPVDHKKNDNEINSHSNGIIGESS